MQPHITQLEKLVALEEEYEQLTARLDALGTQIEELYTVLPPPHSRKDTGTNRLACLKSILAAEKERTQITARCREITRRIDALYHNAPSAPDNPKRGHGELRRILLAELEQAGSKGVTAQELSQKYRIAPRHFNMALCYYMRAGRILNLRRIKLGHRAVRYAILTSEEHERLQTQPCEHQARLKTLHATPAAPRLGTNYGLLRQAIVTALRDAGPEGLHVSSIINQSGFQGNNVRAALSAHIKDGTISGLTRTAPGRYAIICENKENTHAQPTHST